MPSFITQTIDQRPVMLVFHDQSLLAGVLIAQFQAKELDVVVQPLAALYSQGGELIKQLRPFRTIVITDSITELKKVQLRSWGKRVYVIAGCSVGVQSLAVPAAETQLAEHILAEEGIQLITGTELLIPTAKAVFSWQNMIDSSSATFLPLTDPAQFANQVVSLIFQPHPSRHYFISSLAQAFPSDGSSETRSIRFSDQSAKVIELPKAAAAAVFQAVQAFSAARPVPLPKPAVPTPVPVTAKATTPAKRAQGQPPVQAKLPPAAQVIDLNRYSGVIRTTPVYIPKVQNRLRVYEQRTAELKRQKTLKSKLIAPTKKQLVIQGLRKNPPSSKLSEAEIEQVVQSVFKIGRAEQNSLRREVKVEKVVAVKKKSGRRKAVTIIAGMLLGLMVFCGILATLYAGSSWWMANRLTDLVKNYSSLSSNERHFRASEISQVSQFVSLQTEAYELVFGEVQLADVRRQAEIVHAFSMAVQEEQTVQEDALQAANTFLGKKSGDFFQQYLSLSQILQQQYQQLSLVTSQLQALREDQNLDQLPETLAELESQVQEMRRAAVSAQQLDSFIPALFAQKARRTYAVVIENSQELRPTGGLIESVILLTVDNGQLISTQVYDVARLDNQLSGAVNPPTELIKYLGQSRLLLRDSSWFADAPTAANQVRRQVASATNSSIDGVFFLTTPALQKLVAAVGPVSIDDYDEEVTDKNLLTKLEFHSEIQLTDQAKEPYMTAFTRSLMKKISSSPETSLKALEALYTQLRQANALFVPMNSSEASVMAGLGWSGLVTTPDCPAPLTSQNCQVDAIYQVEANVGVNRANSMLTRQIDDQVTLTADQIIHQRSMTFTNNGRSNAWPAGTYKAYLRFFLPQTAVGATLKVGNDSVPLTVDHSESAPLTRQVVGAMIEVPIQQSLAVTLSYSLPKLSNQDYAYTFFEQKQPGLDGDKWSLKLFNQTGLRPTQIAPDGVVEGNTILFSADRDRHQFVGVKFSP